MSLLTITQGALVRIGLPRPDFVANSTDFAVQMMSVLIDEEGRDLSQRHPWQALTREHRFKASGQNPLPDDFSYLLNGTLFDQTTSQAVMPVTPKNWQKNQIRGVSALNTWRIRGNQLLLQNPKQGADYVFEYISKNWVYGDKDHMSADSDTALLDEELITLGAVWRYLKAKGLDYGEAFQSYERRLANAVARDGAKPNLALGHKTVSDNIPEGGWKV